MDGNAIISSNISVNEVYVGPTGALTVNSGVTLISDLTTLESTSTSYPSLISFDNVSGVIDYKRHVNENETSAENDLISAPLSGQSFSDFVLANDNIVTNNAGTLYLFGPFEKPGNTYLTYDAAETAPLAPGIGYRAAATGTNGSTFTFTGDVSSGEVEVNIENSGSSFARWNLIGNPYPSYILAKDFLEQVVFTDTDPDPIVEITNNDLDG